MPSITSIDELDALVERFLRDADPRPRWLSRWESTAEKYLANVDDFNIIWWNMMVNLHTHTYIYLLLLCTYIYFTFNHIYIYYNISLTRRQSWVRQTPPSSSPRGCGTWTASHGCGPAPGPRSRCGGSSRRRWPSSGPFGGGHGSGLTRGVGKNDEELGWEINSI